MTLIVENGTGLANAESYISAADAGTYLANRGDAVWATYSVPAQEAALRLATEYMVSLYRLRWAGFRTLTTQALDWPRSYCPKPDLAGGYGGYPNYYLPTDMPNEVITACADLASRAAVSPLVPDVERLQTSIAIGTLKIEYDKASSPITVFYAINRKLGPLLRGGGPMTKIVRS
jgi:hypothetical protein